MTLINDKDPIFKVGNIVRISKYKKFFWKGNVPNWSQEIFLIKKIKNNVHGHILLMTLKANKLMEGFTKQEK